MLSFKKKKHAIVIGVSAWDVKTKNNTMSH